MISSLEEAWDWYQAAKMLADSMERIGQRFWDLPEWHDALARDNKFRDLESTQIIEIAQTFRKDLDDLAVLVMFSVFEAIVRERALEDVDRELPTVVHPTLVQAMMQLREGLKSGSFFRVTEAYKSHDPDLTEMVNQVRKFRNWVAHGRRGDPAREITPPAAQDRLREYLKWMISPPNDLLR